MVSRRKILSRSRDELHSDIYFMNEDDDEDIWYSKEKLYRVGILLFILSQFRPYVSRFISDSLRFKTNITSRKSVKNKSSKENRK